MDAGERVMRSEFLLGDPREADEGVEMKMREGLKEERRRNTYGRGWPFAGWQGWSSLVVAWEANKGRG